MSAEQITSLVRRKVEAGRESHAARAMTLARALRLTAARQAEKLMELPLSVIGLTRQEVAGDSLAESLDPDALLLLFEGSGGRAALAVLDPGFVTGVIQQQTMGRLLAGAAAAAPRAYTATDAALCAPFIEALLRQAAEMPETQEDRALIGGYRYGLHAETRREACLSLDAPDYHTVTLTVDLAAGQGGGTLTLILPPAPPVPVINDDPGAEAPAPPPRVTLSDGVMDLTAELTVSLTQLTLPLKQIKDWQVGDLVALDLTSLAHSTVLDANGRAISRGTLGQLEGYRAVQLEQKQKPHIHPRRRASDRVELDLPDISAAPEAPQDRRVGAKPVKDADVDVFGGGEELPDMSDLDLDAGDAATEGAAPQGAVRRRAAG